jgi:glucose/arabinose dehydrogenase
MRCDADGRNLELVAWGLRNAYGLGFLPDGRLIAIDQGGDARGSRPLANCPDALFEVRPGAWYGWPDYVCGRPVTSAEFQIPGSTPTTFLLKNRAALPNPEPPLVEFEVNSAAVKFDVATATNHWMEGQLVVALFGDERPMTGPVGPPVGRSLVRIDPTDWSCHPLKVEGFSRPIDVRFGPGGSLFVVDFGAFEVAHDKTVRAGAGTGRVLLLNPGELEVSR